MPNQRNIQAPETPKVVATSPLWTRLATNPEYVSVLLQIRSVATLLASLVASVIPEYTDHSIRHMDLLWQVSTQVLTLEEVEKINPGEAFLLGAAFYLHDLGMALPVTEAGKDYIRTTEQYRTAYRSIWKNSADDKVRADDLAIRQATRELHAQKALEFSTKPIPGLNRFLIEDSDLRDRWSHFIGQIAQSHHWSLEQIERTLGVRKAVPGPDGDNLDLAYIACVLRIVDFAHINRQRALRIERSTRSEISLQSAVHWDAQADVTGPNRDRDMLVFGCTKPLESLEAWWLFHDLAFDLDAEIRSVHEYLNSRSISRDRWSLVGVKGIENPNTFNQYVRLPDNVLPIDIRVQPDSMERVVELLGGRHIYGRDQLAPIRELIQNARDAIELKRSLEQTGGHNPSAGEIVVSVEEKEGQYVLSVQDNGIGMTRNVVRKFLLGVGANFWNSVDFARDFGAAIEGGFRPIGKFGIGFLSVFMLGDRVEVETEAIGNKRIRLILNGVGRRGELTEEVGTGRSGTEVRISLRSGGKELADRIFDIVRARAPMLPLPMIVKVRTGISNIVKRINPGWWKDESDESIASYVERWRVVAYTAGATDNPDEGAPRDWRYGPPARRGRQIDFGGKWMLAGWPTAKPRYTDDSTLLISMGGAPSPGVVVCSQGIAVVTLPIPDITGIAEVGTVEMTVSRESLAASPDSPIGSWPKINEQLTEKFIADLRPAVIARIDDLNKHGMLPGRIDFLRGLAMLFGETLLNDTKLNWIPVTKPPGDLIHQSRRELVDLVRQNKEVLLASGVGAAGAYSMAVPYIPLAKLSEMILVAIRKEEVDINYDLRNRLEREGRREVFEGSLIELRSLDLAIKWDLVIISFLINCVAESWNVPADVLRGQKWYLNYKAEVLLGLLTKP